MSTAMALRHARRCAGLTQDDLAWRSGVGAKTIQRIEVGKSRGCLDSLDKLAIALDITIDDLRPRRDDA